MNVGRGGIIQNVGKILIVLALFIAMPVRADLFGIKLPHWFSTPPRPKPGTRLDRAAFERWARAQPPEAKVLVDFYRQNLQVISQSEFEAALKASFESFLKTRDPKKRILFVNFAKSGNGPKSDTWVTSLLTEKFPEETRDAAIITINSQVSGTAQYETLKALASSGDYQVVIADDASFTGKQITDNALRIRKYVSRADIVVPYMADSVVDYFASARWAEFGYPVKLHRAHNIPTIVQLLAKLPFDARQELIARTAKGRSALQPHLTLTMFDHKTPDFYSFPRWIRDGNVLAVSPEGDISVSNQVVSPFITVGGEPYKECLEPLLDLAG